MSVTACPALSGEDIGHLLVGICNPDLFGHGDFKSLFPLTFGLQIRMSRKI